MNLTHEDIQSFSRRPSLTNEEFRPQVLLSIDIAIQDIQLQIEELQQKLNTLQRQKERLLHVSLNNSPPIG